MNNSAKAMMKMDMLQNKMQPCACQSSEQKKKRITRVTKQQASIAKHAEKNPYATFGSGFVCLSLPHLTHQFVFLVSMSNVGHFVLISRSI